MDIIKSRGFIKDKGDTIYGYKNQIKSLLEDINIYVTELNEFILELKETMNKTIMDLLNSMDDLYDYIDIYNNDFTSLEYVINRKSCGLNNLKTKENLDKIVNLFYVINTEYNIDNIERELNNGTFDISKLENKHSNVNNNSIDRNNHELNKLHKHKYYFVNIKNISGDNNFKRFMNLESLEYKKMDMFKINIDDIDKMFDEIELFYDYLNFNKSEDNVEMKSLCDIFFIKNIENINKKDNIMFNLKKENSKRYDLLASKYKRTNEIGLDVVKNEVQYNLVFPKIPLKTKAFINIYKNVIDENMKPKKIEDILYKNTYLNNYLNTIGNYDSLENNLTKMRTNVEYLCKVYNSLLDNNKLINTKIDNLNKINEEVKNKYKLYTFDESSIKTYREKELYSNMNQYISNILNLKNIFKFSSNNLINNINNNIYNLFSKNTLSFIEEIIETDKLNIELTNTNKSKIIDLFYNLNKIFGSDSTNIQENLLSISKSSINELVIIFYSLLISNLINDTEVFYNLLINISSNQSLVYLFKNTILNNKIFISTIYSFENEKYIELISKSKEGNIVINETVLDLNKNRIKNQLTNIKNELVNLFKKSNMSEIRNKLYLIYKIFSYKKTDNKIKESILNIITKNVIDDVEQKKEIELCKEYFRNNDKVKLFMNNDVQKIFDFSIYYKYNPLHMNQLQCIYEKNNKYECRKCDDDINIVGNLDNCPINLPSNSDPYVKEYMKKDTSIVNDNENIYYITSIVENLGNKKLMYKDNLVSNKIVYGNNEESYGDDHMYLWRCNLNYKSNTIYKNSEDDLALIKLESQNINKQKDFYLNNFFIENKISNYMRENILYRFPNSHQLYVKHIEDEKYNIYFIENNIKYYLYLNKTKKNTKDIQVVFRSIPKINEDIGEKFIPEHIIWKFIKKNDYVHDIFDTEKELYNIRSFNNIKIKNNKYDFETINSLVNANNENVDYTFILKDIYNSQYSNSDSILANYSFEFVGSNNKYKIKSLIKTENNIFNDVDSVLLIDYISYNKKMNERCLKNAEGKRAADDVDSINKD